MGSRSGWLQKSAVLVSSGLAGLLLLSDPAEAHGGHERLDPGVSSQTVRALYLVVVVLSVVVTKRSLSRSLPPGDRQSCQSLQSRVLAKSDTEADSTVRRVCSMIGLAALLLLTGVAVFVGDPFGSVGRVAFMVVFSTLMIPALGFRLWRLFSPVGVFRWCLVGVERPRASTERSYGNSVLLSAGMFTVFWFFLVYPYPAGRLAISTLIVIHLVVTFVAAWLGRNDFFAETLGSFARPPVLVVALAGVWFAVLQHQSWWAVRFGAVGSWTNTTRLTLVLLACVALSTAFVFAVGSGVAWLHRDQPRRSIDVLSAGLSPLTAAMIAAVLLPTLVPLAQDQLYVLYDPLGRGWRPFGEAQGIDVRLPDTWMISLQLIALIAGSVLGIVEVSAAHKGALLDPRSGLAFAAVLAAVGYAALFVVVL